MAVDRPPKKRIAGSDVLELGDCPFVGDVAGVQSRFWLQQQYLRLLIGNRQMLCSMRHDNEFSLTNNLFVIAEFHSQGALDDQEHLIFLLMMMPNELALQLDCFHVRVIDLADDLRTPLIGKAPEFFS